MRKASLGADDRWWLVESEPGRVYLVDGKIGVSYLPLDLVEIDGWSMRVFAIQIVGGALAVSTDETFQGLAQKFMSMK